MVCGSGLIPDSDGKTQKAKALRLNIPNIEAWFTMQDRGRKQRCNFGKAQRRQGNFLLKTHDTKLIVNVSAPLVPYDAGCGKVIVWQLLLEATLVGTECGEGEATKQKSAKRQTPFTEWGQGTQWTKALVRNSTGKATQWRGQAHSVNRQTLKTEFFSALIPFPNLISRVHAEGVVLCEAGAYICLLSIF